MKKTVLKLVDVSKEYDGATPFQALRGMSLEIEEGEFVSIIGPSGSGKSTLLHIMGCLDKPTSGELYLEGHPVSRMNDDQLAEARRNKIGFVFQAFNLAPTLNVFENVELPLMIREIEPATRKKIVEHNLSAVGLSGKARSMPSQLSGGEKQRVAIARALANNPKILLADEPTGNLDSKTSKEIVFFILELCKKLGITVVFVTHDENIAARTDRLIWMMDGKIEKDVRKKRK